MVTGLADLGVGLFTAGIYYQLSGETETLLLLVVSAAVGLVACRWMAAYECLSHFLPWRL